MNFLALLRCLLTACLSREAFIHAGLSSFTKRTEALESSAVIGPARGQGRICQKQRDSGAVESRRRTTGGAKRPGLSRLSAGLPRSCIPYEIVQKERLNSREAIPGSIGNLVFIP